MFARRAAASEGSHARDAAKANLLKWNEKHEKEVSMQMEKIGALHRDRDKIKNVAIRAGVEAQIEREQQILEELRAKHERLTSIARSAKSSSGSDHNVDVLAEISAHSLPLGKSAAHHAAPTIYEWGPNVELPEVSRQEIDDAYDQATDPITALKPPVAPDIRSASAKLTAGGELGGELGGAHPAVQQTVQHMLSPTGMLALQQQAMEKRLGRPMREDEARKMKAEARASAMASLSFLVGTACCMVAAAFAGVFVWRQYGKPRSREQIGEVQAQVAVQQKERKARYEATVGPVVSSIKVTSEVAISEHEGLKNFAAGLRTNQATRYVPPPPREAELKAQADARAAQEAREERERAEAHAAIVAAEAAWQASGGAVMGLEDTEQQQKPWYRRRSG